MVVSLNRGTPIQTPKYYGPYYWYPQNGTPNFGKPPLATKREGFGESEFASIEPYCRSLQRGDQSVLCFRSHLLLHSLQ